MIVVSNMDLKEKSLDSGIDEPVIVETHQNNFTISSFDEHSIVHDPTSPGGIRAEGDSLVIEQQASNSNCGETIEQRSENEIHKGTIEESIDGEKSQKLHPNESSYTSDDPSSSDLCKESPLPPSAKKEKAKNKRKSANAESPVLKS